MRYETSNRAPTQKPTAAKPSCEPAELDTGSSSLSGVGSRRRPIDFAELRRRVCIQQVLEQLAWRPVARNGPQLRGPCPIHRGGHERSRSFAVNTNKNVFHCFKPACGAEGNQLDLYALATGLPILEAAHQLCERLGLEPPILSSHQTER
jgi:DNA primase